MAQKKEMDLPAAETLSCFQAANAKPAASTLPPISGTARSAEHQMDGTVGRMEGAGVIPVDTKVTVAEALGAQSTSAANRCSGCQRKVGLTGFRCRCGDLFCGKHRYSDRHDCSFDYKTAGQTAISRENPLVRASKILRI